MELATDYLHDQVVWLLNSSGSFNVGGGGSVKLPRPELELTI